MPLKSFRQAINEALAEEMQRDPTVFVMGEDIAGGMGAAGEQDAWGGAFAVTKGLLGKFGRGRVIDTPISETAYLGLAVGAANTGLRPVVEIMFVDFFGVCLDQVMNNAALFRYMYGGKACTPITIRTSFGAGEGAAAQHSQSLYSIFTHIPGLKVVIPSGAHDAKGLLISAIRDDDPVIFFEHKQLYNQKQEVPAESYAIPLGQAKVLRSGGDVTVVALGRMVSVAEKALRQLEADGINGSLIDPRTLSPLDFPTILADVQHTRRLVVVEEAYPRCGFARELGGSIVAREPGLLQAVRYVTAPHAPVPYAPNLESLYLPSVKSVATAIREVCR
jgi:acetoin:2,6-dichlorophenolindophenol oxidoreductase subunit beta